MSLKSRDKVKQGQCWELLKKTQPSLNIVTSIFYKGLIPFLSCFQLITAVLEIVNRWNTSSTFCKPEGKDINVLKNQNTSLSTHIASASVFLSEFVIFSAWILISTMAKLRTCKLNRKVMVCCLYQNGLNLQ